MKITHVYDRLPLTLKKLWLYKLLGDETQYFAPDPLELLSLDMTSVLSETNNELVIDMVREEYRTMAQYSSLEPELYDIEEELDDLIRFLFRLRYEYRAKKLGQLKAVYLKLPDCVILEYHSAKDNDSCRDTSSPLSRSDTRFKTKSFATLMERINPKNV